MNEPTEQEIAAAAQAIYEMRFNIDFARASAAEVELALSSARAALRAAASARVDEQTPDHVPLPSAKQNTVSVG